MSVNKLENELNRAKNEGLLTDDDVELIKQLSTTIGARDVDGEMTVEEGKTDKNIARPPAKSYDEEQPDSDKPTMKFHEFFNELLQRAKKVCRDHPEDHACFLIITEEAGLTLLLFKKGKLQDDNLRKSALSIDGEKVVSVTFSSNRVPNKAIAFEPNEFNTDIADEKFGINRARSKLQEYCNARLLPLESSWGAEGVLDPRLKYVEVDQGMNEFDNYHHTTQVDKAYALVVAGESGSGKSVFSCLQVKRKKYLPVYLLLDGRHRNQEKPESDFKEVHKILRQMIDSLIRQDDGENDINQDDGEIDINQDDGENDINKLFEIKRKLNKKRNKWAVEIFETTLENFAIFPPPPEKKKKRTKLDELRNDDYKHTPNVQSWLKGGWGRDMKPEKVAIILDEATDIDLVEGIVEEIRDLKSRWQGRLSTNDLMIVLTGTGLDSIRSPGRIRTNPAYSRLVKLKGPNLAELKNDSFGEMIHDDAEGFMAAVKQGLFSNVMRTNSRMFFRGVLPIFRSHFLVKDASDYNGNSEETRAKKRTRYTERCKAVGSFGPMMSYVVRFYVDENLVGQLNSEKRKTLLKCSFLYHLISGIRTPSIHNQSIKDIQEKELEAAMNIRSELRITNDNEEEVFSRGLATRSGTSPALKYLACYGLTCLVRPAFGDEFEELVALHYIRLMEIQGYITKRFTLQHAWPP